MTQTTVDLAQLYDTVKVGDPNPTSLDADKGIECDFIWVDHLKFSNETRYCTRPAHTSGQHVSEGPETVLSVKPWGDK